MPAYAEAARTFGAAAAGRGLGVVYGGGRVGLMGAVADAALAAGGEVVGAIPQELVDRELAHPGLTELHVVGSLHERKALMAELSDAFVALPGGFGTLDELMEQLTWSQLGLHAKPVGLLDVEDYWRPLIALARHATAEGFVRESDLAAIAVADDAESLLDRLDGMTREERPRPKWSRPPEPSSRRSNRYSMTMFESRRQLRSRCSANASVKTSASACAAAGRTSSTAIGRPSSRAIDVKA